MEIDSERIGKLTLAKISDLCNQDIREIKRINAKSKGIQELDDISACVELSYLDLSKNLLTDLQGIFHCKTITILNVSNNNLDSLSAIWKLRKLSILNASHNKLPSTIFLEKLKNLKALILNNNYISLLTNTTKLKMLNTLILSNNQLEEINLSSLVSLVKLSLSHNKLRMVPNLKHNSELKDLRLNDNKITEIGQNIDHNPRLQIVDFGNNRLHSMKDVEPLLTLQQLRNVNLKGNPISTEANDKELQDKLLGLKVFNSRKILRNRKFRSTLSGGTSTENFSECTAPQATKVESKLEPDSNGDSNMIVQQIRSSKKSKPRNFHKLNDDTEDKVANIHKKKYQSIGMKHQEPLDKTLHQTKEKVEEKAKRKLKKLKQIATEIKNTYMYESKEKMVKAEESGIKARKSRKRKLEIESNLSNDQSQNKKENEVVLLNKKRASERLDSTIVPEPYPRVSSAKGNELCIKKQTLSSTLELTLTNASVSNKRVIDQVKAAKFISQEVKADGSDTRRQKQKKRKKLSTAKKLDRVKLPSSKSAKSQSGVIAIKKHKANIKTPFDPNNFAHINEFGAGGATQWN